MLRQGINIGNCQDAKEHVNVSVSQLFPRCIGPIESLEKIAAQGINMIEPKVSWWLPLWKKLRSHNSNRLWRSSSPSLHIGFICFMAMGRLWKVAASVRCDPLIHSTLKASSRSTWRRNSQVVPTKNGIERTLTHIVTLSCLFGTSPVHKGALRVWVVNLRSEGWKANTKGDFRLGLSRHLCLQIVDHTPTQVLSLFQVQTGDFEHPSVTTNYTTRTIRICAGSHDIYVYFPVWLDDPSRKRIPRRKVYYCRHLTVSWHVSKLAGIPVDCLASNHIV